MPNLRDKTWTPTTPAQTADAQFWEDHLIDDASYEGLQEILEGGGGGGHVIQNPSGTEMPQQPVLQFINATVTNGEGKTIVSGNGEKGDAATVAVGTVTTGAAGTNAQVTNSGTQYDAVLDFVIPRGADGNGLPSGGSNGQVLYKDTSASTGGSWGDLPESVLSVSGKTPDAQGNVDIDASDVALGSGTVETLAGSIATIETSPATANHAVGEYIVYNGQLYKVTTAITAGQSLAVGTNISATNVGSNIRDLNTIVGKMSATDSITNTSFTAEFDSLGSTDTSFKTFFQNATDSPSSSAAGIVLTYRSTANYGWQIALYNGHIAVRAKSSGTWGTWSLVI